MTFPCNYCGILSLSNMMCQRCQSVRYCSKVCQKRDWKWNPEMEQKRMKKCGNRIQHKDKCQAPDKEFPKIPNYWKEYEEWSDENNNNTKKEKKILVDSSRIFKQHMLSEEIDTISIDEWHKIDEVRFEESNQRVNKLIGLTPRAKLGEYLDVARPQLDLESAVQSVFRNHAPLRLRCHSGETNVGIGYTDLYQMLISEYPPLEDIQKPIHFIGIDCGYNQTARARVILEMMLDPECSNQSILQAWFSTAMSPKAIKSFKRACNSALAKFIPDSDWDARVIIYRWTENPIPTVKEVQEQFREKLEDNEILLLNCLKNKKDRMDYIDYIFHGDLFLDDMNAKKAVGNPSFWTIDVTPGGPMRDSIFFHLDVETFEAYETSLLATLEKYLNEKLTTLRTLVQTEKLRCKFRQDVMGAGLKQNGSFMSSRLKNNDRVNATFLRSLNPAVIDWTNVPDFFTKKDFFDFMKTCGSKSTIHTFHSNNWYHSLFGASIYDFRYLLGTTLKPDDVHLVARNAFNLDQRIEFEKKPYLKNFLVPNGLRYFPVSMMELACADAMKENYVKEVTKTLSVESALRIERFGIKNHWSMLSRKEMSSFDLIMTNKTLKQEDKDYLIEKHLKL